MVSMLKELEAVTLMVFELLLTFISVPKLQSKSSSWFVVSKLVHPKRIACEGEETDVNEFEKVDVVLQSLISHRQANLITPSIFRMCRIGWSSWSQAFKILKRCLKVCLGV